MAVITFSKQVSFPTAPLRDLLQKHLPLFKWQCGEQDMGAAKEIGCFLDHMLIVGRSPTTAIFTELRSVESRLPGPAPQHVWHLQVGDPTTDISTIAHRVTLIICMTVMILDEHGAMCQLRPGGNWLSPHDLLRVFNVVLAGESISVADGLGIPVGRLEQSDPPRHDPPTPPTDTDFMAAQMIDGALQSVIASTASEPMRQLLPDIAAERSGRPIPAAPPPPPAAPPVASPLRRVGGFGRKGL